MKEEKEKEMIITYDMFTPRVRQIKVGRTKKKFGKGEGSGSRWARGGRKVEIYS